MEPKLGIQKDGSELLKVGDDLICWKDKHNFAYKSSSEAKCTKCPLGYPIGVGNTLKDGHIYKDYILVI